MKNTVTNVLYFLLFVKIYRQLLQEEKVDGIVDKDKFLETAYTQCIWFDSWFGLCKHAYQKTIPSGGALVQEQPPAFEPGSDCTDYKETMHPTWEKGWTWTGDQTGILAV